MEAFLASTGIVALAEIGDKTQLLAFILAAKFRKPWPIVLGILAATLVNHGVAGALGSWITSLVQPHLLRWVLGLSFIGMAIWTLIPDRFDEGSAKFARFGVFGTTLIAFFLAEMGDKTQIATVALAAHYDALLAVVAGTTLGMMIANVPAVFLGNRIANRMPVKLVHRIAASIFLVLGVATLFGGDGIISENIRHEQRKVIKYNQLVANMVILDNVHGMSRVLKGAADEWRGADGRNIARYGAVSPGSYQPLWRVSAGAESRR